MDTDRSESEDAAAGALALDFWKLLKVCERLSGELPDDRRVRWEAQLRFSSGRLEKHLQALGLELHTYQGMQFGPEIPAVAVNAEDFSSAEDLTIESAIEPALILRGRVLQNARVMLKERDADVSGN